MNCVAMVTVTRNIAGVTVPNLSIQQKLVLSKSKETGKGTLNDVKREVHQDVLCFENVRFQAEM
jgi:hypothetical protein